MTMNRKLFLATLALFAFVSASVAQKNGDDLVGLWLASNGDARVKIDKDQDGTYFGRIVWLREPNDENGNPKVDKNNPDESVRHKRILGMRMLNSLKFVKNGLWEEGTIYDPKNGSTYSCSATMLDANTIELRGFIGVSLFGRTQVWNRLVKKD